KASDPAPMSPAAGHAAPTPDAPNQPAGQVDSLDAGSDDAGSIDSRAPECVASWSELPFPAPSAPDLRDASDLPRPDPPSAECRGCACDACASAILDCLHNGSAVERGLCRDMLTCALRERCQEYDCYCASSGCAFPDGIGDGPCAEEINAAAGGTRSRVIALRNADPPDLNEPLVRATQAIACILGEHPSSPGPTIAGNCNVKCQ
ncbi:MAG TPA: hypothetical protein VJV78_30955, partial [Polyangiales bacterium]|nr:hypothetical protein [Polyangiales bacterium]